MSSALPRMPPFSGLLAFEAALRHGSMTLAGDELGLTQSAISHRIRGLEEFFGAPLLQRLNPGLRATEAGAHLARELAPLLGALAGMRRRIAGRPGPRAFRLGLSTSLLAWWLSPRLPALCAAFPDLSIEVSTWDTAAAATRVEVDLALVWLPHAGGVEGPCDLSFPAESVFPVVAPRLLKTIRPGQDWRALPLLAKGRRDEEIGREWSWATWLRKAAGHEAMRFPDIGSSLQAAMEGHGVALARSLLVADALRQRRLRRLAGPSQSHASSRIQVARWIDPGDRTAERMAGWLVSSAGREVVEPSATTPSPASGRTRRGAARPVPTPPG